jgi:hypothetical protein
MHLIKPVFILLFLFVVSRGTALTVENTEQSLQENTRVALRITFSESMVLVGNPQEPVPSGLTITPNTQGTWSWGSQSTLLFTPDKIWQAGIEHTVTIPSGIVSAISGNKLKKKYMKNSDVANFRGISEPPKRYLRQKIRSELYSLLK